MNVRFQGLAVAAGLGAVLLVSCGKTPGSNPPARAEGQPRPVSVARAELRPMTLAIRATGTLAAQERSTLSAKVSGRLQQLTVDIGSVVHRGDILAQVEPRDYELR